MYRTACLCTSAASVSPGMKSAHVRLLRYLPLLFAFTIMHRNGGALPLLSTIVKASQIKMGLPGNKAMSVYLLAHDEPADAY